MGDRGRAQQGDRLATIARTIGRTQQTVTREVRTNWTDSPKGRLVVETRNICVHASACVRADLCGKGCLTPCYRCKRWLCNSLRPDFETRV